MTPAELLLARAFMLANLAATAGTKREALEIQAKVVDLLMDEGPEVVAPIYAKISARRSQPHDGEAQSEATASELNQ